MKKTPEVKAQTYLRLLSYAKPYKVRLIIGIVAGFVVGGSLFGSLMLIPSLMTGIEFTNKSADAELPAKQLLTAINQADSDAQKLEAIRKVIA